MNSSDFKHILQHPQDITAEYTAAIQSVVEEYPYFQSARALYLKGLKNKGSFKYNLELKITAAYTTDRSILFDFITSEVFLQNEVSQQIMQNAEYIRDIEVDAEDISITRKVTIDRTLEKQVEDTKGVLDPDLFLPKIDSSKIANLAAAIQSKAQSSTSTVKEPQNSEIKQINKPENKKDPKAILKIGQPLEFERSETYSFNEWLKLAHYKPIEREVDIYINKNEELTSPKSSEIDLEEKQKRAKKFELIDKFITTNPKIKPQKNSSTQNLANDRLIQPEALMTETLARIYVEQKNYRKAIESYKILCLKYPEKNAFFADQIKAIKELQEQNKKE